MENCEITFILIKRGKELANVGDYTFTFIGYRKNEWWIIKTAIHEKTYVYSCDLFWVRKKYRINVKKILVTIKLEWVII